VTRPAAQSFDVDELLDLGSWTGPQKYAIALVALAVVLDGFDNQLLGFAIPALIADWGLARTDFAPALACSLIGMTLGSAIGGRLGDQIGRRKALLGSALLFSVATLAVAWANGVLALTALRFLAGLGMGGVMPNATTLSTEYTPARNASTAVIVTIVCFPLGGMFAGIVAAQVLPTLGWRTLFLIGGCAGLVVTMLLAMTLPESPRFLARDPSRRRELEASMSRLGHRISAEIALKIPTQGCAEDRSGVVASLFARELVRDTFALWAAFFASMACVYMAFSWLPSALAAQGVDLAGTSKGLAAYNLGGVLGPLSCAWLVRRAGSRWPMMVYAIAGALSALALNALNIGHEPHRLSWFATLAIHGFFVNGVQTSLYALAAHIYLTRVRATGVAAAVAVGRLGGITVAFFGASAIQVGSVSHFTGLLGAGMLTAAIGIWAVSRHIPPLRASK
jgi:MFS transporter, AAHS family, 4-hydroxybenzoate transporter